MGKTSSKSSINGEIYRNFKCVFILGPIFPSKTTINSSNSGSTTNHISTVVGMDSKRAVLEYLQKHCSTEFLREQRINSNSEVVLRKTNNKNQSLEASSNTMSNQRMKEIYKELLQFDNYERSPTS